MASSKQPKAKPVPPGEKAKLWRMALGLCSFADCKKDLVYESNVPLFGAQAAHIVADSVNGPRGEDPLPLSGRHLYENLILLCPNHHDEIDTLVDQYPVAELHRIKAEHEAQMAALRKMGSGWSSKFISVDYLNLPRLLMFDGTGSIAAELERRGLGDLSTLRGMGMRRFEAVTVGERALPGWSDRAVALDNTTVNEVQPGTVVSFSRRFWVKNIPAPDEAFPPPQDPMKGPHVWAKYGETKFVIRLDPAWITASTAFSVGAHGNYSGLALVVGRSSSGVLASCIVLGQPLTPDMEWFYER